MCPSAWLYHDTGQILLSDNVIRPSLWLAGARVASIKPALLAEILRDPALAADRCARLVEALPHANVSQMIALQPSLLLEVLAATSVLTSPV